MISSINGAVFDSWTLTKPANFKADVAGRDAFVKSWVPQYVPGAPYPKGGTSLETQGAPAHMHASYNPRPHQSGPGMSRSGKSVPPALIQPVGIWVQVCQGWGCLRC